MKKDRKSDEKIKVEILKSLIKHKFQNVLIETIKTDLKSNWLTIKKYILQLEQQGLIIVTRAVNSKGNTQDVCVSLNTENISLLLSAIKLNKDDVSGFVHQLFQEQRSGE